MNNIDNNDKNEKIKQGFFERIGDVNFKIKGISDEADIQKKQIEFLIKRKNEIYLETISKLKK